MCHLQTPLGWSLFIITSRTLETNPLRRHEGTHECLEAVGCYLLEKEREPAHSFLRHIIRDLTRGNYNVGHKRSISNLWALPTLVLRDLEWLRHYGGAFEGADWVVTTSKPSPGHKSPDIIFFLSIWALTWTVAKGATWWSQVVPQRLCWHLASNVGP